MTTPGPAVFIDDDGEVELLGLHFTQERRDALGLRHEMGRAAELRDQALLVALAHGAHDVAGVGDADDVVER